MADEKYGIPSGYNNQLVQEYLSRANAGISAKRATARDSLDTTNSMLYETLGRSQLQNERDIAQRRIQAQRSGMTSSQLAAMEMQNIMVGQMGAQQVAQQYRQEQALMEQQFAGAEDDIYAGLFNTFNQNAGQIAAVDAQRFSASGLQQIQELFPDAPRDVQLLLAKDYMGYTLSSAEQVAISKYKIVNRDPKAVIPEDAMAKATAVTTT